MLDIKVATLQETVDASERDGKTATPGAGHNCSRAAGAGLEEGIGPEASQEAKAKELQGLVDFFKRNREELRTCWWTDKGAGRAEWYKTLPMLYA